MRARTDDVVVKLQRDLRRAQELVEAEELDEARALLTRVRQAARSAGLRSAHVYWALAVACDAQEDFEMAMSYLREALALDPLDLRSLRSFDIVTRHIREALLDPARRADAEDTPRLYRLLADAGEADTACHLVMARHELHAGRVAEARARVDAVLLLAPCARAAWALRAEVARLQGDAEAQRAAEVEAAALEAAEGPVFGIGGTRGEPA